MTTVSIVECVCPVSLRSCGSSVGRLLLKRKQLQKRSSLSRQSSHDLTGYGLEGALISSPIPSPIPRSTIPIYGGRTSKQSSSSLNDSCDDEPEEEIPQTSSCNTPDLFVMGSKPSLRGMWEVSDSHSVTPTKDQPTGIQDMDDIFDPVAEDDCVSSASPENPPPSPINFRPGIDRFMIGGQKLMCPERCSSSASSYNRDFKPGYFKQPFHHCLKCEGRVKGEELSQVTLQRRLNSILCRHSSKRNVNEDALSYYRDHSNPMQIGMPDQCDTRSFSCTNSQDTSFYDIYSEKKRLKKEKQRAMKEQRDKRKEERRNYEFLKLNQKLKMKEERSRRVLSDSSIGRHREMKQKPSVMTTTFLGVGEKSSANVDVNALSDSDELHLPQICTKTTTPPHSANVKADNRTKLEQLSSATDKTSSASVVNEEKEETPMDIKVHIRRSWSEDLRHNQIPVEPVYSKSTATEKVNIEFNSSPALTAPSTSTGENSELQQIQDSPADESRSKRDKVNIEFNSSPALTAPSTTGENSELQQIQDSPAVGSRSKPDTPTHGATMSSTLIVPDRDIPCTEWVSFNGDSEPILNTSPQVQDSCDTFLKRLQRTKLYNQNDPALQYGQQFCFEAMVDKRYNRWKRRRRKKHPEPRRTTVIQGSESSDENDERYNAMERIIDRMYEEIHGPARQTPGGSTDTPRTRNRRRRKYTNSSPTTPANDVYEQDSSVTLYDASSERTSDGCLQSSLSANQLSNTEPERTFDCCLQSLSSANQLSKTEPDEAFTCIYDPELDTLQASQSGTVPEDMCSSPYLEQCKSEALTRLKSMTPDMDENDWLSDTKDVKDDSVDLGNIGNDNHIDIGDIGNDNRIDIGDIGNDIQDEIVSITGKEEDDETTPDEYEPYIRVTEMPIRSHVPVSNETPDANRKNGPAKTKIQFDQSKQIYSYTKWSRTQRPVVKKQCSVEQKPKSLSRPCVTSWGDTGCDPDFQASSANIPVTDKKLEQIPFRPIKNQEIIQQTKHRLAKKTQKVALDIKKQNVNLPSLTKTPRSQTILEAGGKAKVKPKPAKILQERPHTEPPSYESSQGESQAVSDMMLKDYYLRSLYGHKTRINSHVDSKHDKALRKTLTVDNLELLAKKPRKKPDKSKPNDPPLTRSFTRSFTFSMFDLPEVYKLYNTTLERRAAGEEIETQ